MRNPLISMLYPTVIITVKEVLLTGTESPIKITMSAVETTARTNHPGKTVAKNQCVTGPYYITKCSQYQKDKDKYKHTTQWVKQNLQDKLKLGAKKRALV